MALPVTICLIISGLAGLGLISQRRRKLRTSGMLVPIMPHKSRQPGAARPKQ
jgi:hypothetical protein